MHLRIACRTAVVKLLRSILAGLSCVPRDAQFAGTLSTSHKFYLWTVLNGIRSLLLTLEFRLRDDPLLFTFFVPCDRFVDVIPLCAALRYFTSRVRRLRASIFSAV